MKCAAQRLPLHMNDNPATRIDKFPGQKVKKEDLTNQIDHFAHRKDDPADHIDDSAYQKDDLA
jgi:hypothetical protein